jgi:hypothetical protein
MKMCSVVDLGNARNLSRHGTSLGVRLVTPPFSTGVKGGDEG